MNLYPLFNDKVQWEWAVFFHPRPEEISLVLVQTNKSLFWVVEGPLGLRGQGKKMSLFQGCLFLLFQISATLEDKTLPFSQKGNLHICC